MGAIIRLKIPRSKKALKGAKPFQGWKRPSLSLEPFRAPETPIQWTPAALAAYRAAYSSVRQWPGNRNYFLPICLGLDAALIAQGVAPCPTWTGSETDALDRAERGFIANAGGHLTLFDRHVADAALIAGFNAALDALDRRVVPLITRASLRTRQRARRIAEVKQETENWHRLRAVKEAFARLDARKRAEPSARA